MYSENFNNLGQNPSLGIITNYTVPDLTKSQVTQPAPSFWDKFNKISDSILNVGNKVVDTVQNLQTGKTITQTQLQQQQQAIQDQQKQKSNVLKYVLIAAGTLLAGGIVYKVATSGGGKKKSLKGLGDLNTAKTKAGKERQRKAVFARLAQEGAKPKRKARKAKAKKVRI